MIKKGNILQLFDLGPDGGDNEGDGELIGETDEVAFECGARYKFHPTAFSCTL